MLQPIKKYRFEDYNDTNYYHKKHHNCCLSDDSQSQQTARHIHRQHGQHGCHLQTMVPL